MAAFAVGPEAVAKVIEKAITARRPRTRYVITLGARMLMGMRRGAARPRLRRLPAHAVPARRARRRAEPGHRMDTEAHQDRYRSWCRPLADPLTVISRARIDGRCRMTSAAQCSGPCSLAMLLSLTACRADETCMSAVHAEDHRAGGLRLRLDARRRRRRRRLGQAGHHRRQPEAPDLRQGRSSSASVGGRHEAHHGGFTDDRRYLWMGGLDDSPIYVFDVATDPGQAEAREDHRLVREGQRRRRRPAHLLRPARPHADHRPLQRRRQGRQDGAGRVQQRRRVRADHLDAGRGAATATTCACSRASTAC